MYIYIILQYDLYMCNLFHTFYFLKKMKTKNFMYINTFSYHIQFMTSLIILIYKP